MPEILKRDIIFLIRQTMRVVYSHGHTNWKLVLEIEATKIVPTEFRKVSSVIWISIFCRTSKLDLH